MYIVYIHELALSRSPIAWFIFLPNVLLGLQIVLHIYGWCARVYVLLYKTKQTRRVHVRNVCKKKIIVRRTYRMVVGNESRNHGRRGLIAIKVKSILLMDFMTCIF